MDSVNLKHPARNARQMAGAASVAAFVGAAIAIATNGHNGSTQPAGAATTPSTTPATVQPNSPYDAQGDNGWGATPPDQGFQFNGGGNNGSFVNPPSHSSSGAS